MIGAGRIVLFSFLLLLSAATAVPSHVLAFGLDDVAARAAKLAASPYQKPSATLPKVIKALDYDSFRDIRFRPERAMWRGMKLPFEVMFFHRGWFYEEPVAIHEIIGQGVQDIAFDADTFDYGRNKIDRNEVKGLGFAGFRVHFPVNTQAYKDEVLVFLGASYFRALGQGQQFGLSARGLAIDTAESSGEEFPRFVEFWIERPQRGGQGAHHLRPAGFAAGDRRLPLRAEAGRDDGARHRRPSCFCARTSPSWVWRR